MVFLRCSPVSDTLSTITPLPSENRTTMPADTKPLFRPEALRKKLDAFLLPDRCEAVRLKFTNWARKLNEGKLDKDTEIQLLPIFLTHIFEGLLGYTGPISDSGFDAYTMKREMLIEVDGKRADAAFGQFGSGEEKYAVVLEGKGPLDTWTVRSRAASALRSIRRFRML